MRKNIIAFVVVHLYSLTLTFFKFFVAPLLAKIDKNQRWHIIERLRFPFPAQDYRGFCVVWIHAASLGESKLVLTFIETLKRKYPKVKYIVTSMTASGVEYLRRYCTDSIIAVGFMPLDTISNIKNLLDHYNISRVWIMETELWPGMLWACMKKKIPIGLVNARMEVVSWKWYKRFALCVRPCLGYVDIILAQDEIYARRFIELGAKKEVVHVTGNLKSNVIIRRPPLQTWRLLRSRLNISEQTLVLTCGSVHENEGKELRKTLEILRKNDFLIKSIIVPRYPKEVESLKRELGSGCLHLKESTTTRFWDVCILDMFGILEDAYAIADVAFIGGTFVDIGGHNVWEAAKFGIPVFFGPHYHTQRQSCNQLIEAGIGFVATSAAELAQAMIRVLRTEAKKFIESQRQFADYLNNRKSLVETLI